MHERGPKEPQAEASQDFSLSEIQMSRRTFQQIILAGVAGLVAGCTEGNDPADARFGRDFAAMAKTHAGLAGVFNFHYRADSFEHEARSVTRALLTAGGIVGEKSIEEIKTTYERFSGPSSIVAKNLDNRSRNRRDDSVATFSSVAEAVLATTALISGASHDRVEKAYEQFSELKVMDPDAGSANAVRSLLAAAVILGNKTPEEVMEIFRASKVTQKTNFLGFGGRYDSSIQQGIYTLTVATSGGTPARLIELGEASSFTTWPAICIDAAATHITGKSLIGGNVTELYWKCSSLADTRDESSAILTALVLWMDKKGG